jgi:hypothetical protein
MQPLPGSSSAQSPAGPSMASCAWPKVQDGQAFSFSSKNLISNFCSCKITSVDGNLPDS